MAVGDIITAARYNALQNRISVIMGVGSGRSGYGQAMSSNQKSVGSTINLTDIAALRLDMIKARQHQSGADESISFPSYTNADSITEVAFANLETQMSLIENNKFSLGANQGTLGTAVTSQRTLPWNSTISHTLSIDFGTANNARYFFNSGGEIRTYASISGFTGVIGNDWNIILTNMGTIKMGATSTTSTGTGTGTNIGFYNLTNMDQLVFTKQGSGNYLYAVNDYSVFASCDVAFNPLGGARYVFLTIQFNDDKGPRPNVDESPGGTTTSYVQCFRASGSNVSVGDPVISTLTGLQ